MYSIKEHPHLRELVERWEADAQTLSRYGNDAGAQTVRALAAELRQTMAMEDEPTYNLTEAADLTGYKADTLSKKVRRGEIPNRGRKNAPRVRLSDCPRREQALPAASAPIYLLGRSKEQIARSVVAQGG